MDRLDEIIDNFEREEVVRCKECIYGKTDNLWRSNMVLQAKESVKKQPVSTRQ